MTLDASLPESLQYNSFTSWEGLFYSFNERSRNSIIANRGYNDTDLTIIQLVEAIFSLDNCSGDTGVGGIVASFLDRRVFRCRLMVKEFDDREEIFPILSQRQLEAIQNIIRDQMIKEHAMVLMFFKDEAEGYLSAISTLSQEEMQNYSGRYLFQTILPNTALLNSIQELLPNSSNSQLSEELTLENQRERELEELTNRISWISEDKNENLLLKTINQELAIVAFNTFRLMEALYKFNIPFGYETRSYRQNRLTLSRKIKPYDYYERASFHQKFISIFQALKKMPNQAYFKFLNSEDLFIANQRIDMGWFSRNLKKESMLYFNIHELMFKPLSSNGEYLHGTERLMQSIFLSLKQISILDNDHMQILKKLREKVGTVDTYIFIMDNPTNSLLPESIESIEENLINILIKRAEIFVNEDKKANRHLTKYSLYSISANQFFFKHLQNLKAYYTPYQVNEEEFSSFFPNISMNEDATEERTSTFINEEELSPSNSLEIMDSPEMPRERTELPIYSPITIEEIFEEFPSRWLKPIEESPLPLTNEEEPPPSTDLPQIASSSLNRAAEVTEEPLTNEEEAPPPSTNSPQIISSTTEIASEPLINRKNPNSTNKPVRAERTIRALNRTSNRINWINPVNWFIWILNQFCCSVKYV